MSYTGTPWPPPRPSTEAHLQGPASSRLCVHSCFTGWPRVCGPGPGAFPSEGKETPSAGLQTTAPSSQRPRPPTAQPLQGSLTMSPSRWPLQGGEGPRCSRTLAEPKRCRPPRPGRARVGAGRLRGGPDPESPLPSPHLSFPRTSATGTKWQSAAPRAGRDAPGLRDCAAASPPTAPGRASGDRGARGPRPATAPPPSARAGARAGHARSASLPVKVSRGPAAGGGAGWGFNSFPAGRWPPRPPSPALPCACRRWRSHRGTQPGEGECRRRG